MDGRRMYTTFQQTFMNKWCPFFQTSIGCAVREVIDRTSYPSIIETPSKIQYCKVLKDAPKNTVNLTSWQCWQWGLHARFLPFVDQSCYKLSALIHRKMGLTSRDMRWTVICTSFVRSPVCLKDPLTCIYTISQVMPHNKPNKFHNFYNSFLQGFNRTSSYNISVV